MLKAHMKGLGKQGLDIFRRVQALWPEAYSFVDQRTLSAAGSLVYLARPRTSES